MMQNVLTTKEVSKKLHMGINQTRELIKRDDFPKITIGKKWLIPENELDKWLSQNIGKKLKLDKNKISN